LVRHLVIATGRPGIEIPGFITPSLQDGIGMMFWVGATPCDWCVTL